MENLENFINLFDLSSLQDFEKPIAYKNEFGFSIKTKTNRKGFASLYKFFILKTDKDKKIQPLQIRVSYGKATNEGIIIASSNLKIGIISPLNIESGDDFYYDQSKKIFLQDGQEINGQEIIKKIQKKHLSPYRPSCLSLEVYVSRIKIKIIDSLLFTLTKLYAYISQQKIENYFSLSRTDPYQDEYMLKSTHPTKLAQQENQDNLLGIRVSRSTLVVFSVLQFSIFISIHISDYSNNTLNTFMKNNLLISSYVVLSIEIIDKILTKLLLLVTQKIEESYLKEINKKIHFKI